MSIYNRDANSATTPAAGNAASAPNSATPGTTAAPVATPPTTQHTNIYGTPLP